MRISRLFSVNVLVPLLAGLAAGVILGPLQFSCGQVVENPVCAQGQCAPGPTGPQGPAGPAGPAGSAGPSLGSCHWHYTDCQAATECEQICPANTFPVSGSCDGAVGATLTEHRASVDPAKPFPASGAPFSAFDRWHCRTAGGTLQFVYALCCAP
jgi:hypothetical protein